MYGLLFWIYVINASLLIVHEMDSTYWKEWELFGIPGGRGFFLFLHIPLTAVIITGAVFLHRMTTAGLIISFVIAVSGVFAFTIHNYYLKEGHKEFDSVSSKLILYATLIVSLLQGVLTVHTLIVG